MAVQPVKVKPLPTGQDPPVFDKTDPCPKCGFWADEWPPTFYCLGDDECAHPDNTHDEHLHVTCPLCGYQYVAQVLPNGEAEKRKKADEKVVQSLQDDQGAADGFTG